MRLIKSIDVWDGSVGKQIQFLQGDLTKIPEQHAVDVLVVSAFPRSYQEIDGTLIAALGGAGLSVADLAMNPEADLRENFSCWLSRPIGKQKKGLSFSRVLCFEPATRGRAPEVVGDIFRALAPFVHGSPHVRSIALPLVATGSQSFPIREMLPPLINAAWHQLQAGLPLKTIKIVAFRESDVEEALRYFREPRRTILSRWFSHKRRPPAAPSSRPNTTYDVFVSYARADQATAKQFSDILTRRGLRVFMDVEEIEIGSSWQQRIWDALETCRRSASLYSPEFLASKVCKDEFNAAMILRRRHGDAFIFPLLLRDAELPAYMEMLNYRDCRISDRAKIEAAATLLADELQS